MMFNPTRNTILALAALAISCATAASTSGPARASTRACLYIDSSGRAITTVFWGLRPDTRFANLLSALSKQAEPVSRQASAPHMQNLVYRESCPKQNLRNAAFPQGGTCYGQYMVPEYRDCTLGCGGHSYRVFFSTGDVPCNGYYPSGDACGGCENQETGCVSCD
jgi:hypothetical protein